MPRTYDVRIQVNIGSLLIVTIARDNGEAATKQECKSKKFRFHIFYL